MGKRRRRTSSCSSATSSFSSGLDAEVLFGVMLAALSNPDTAKQVIKKPLNHLLLSLLSKPPSPPFHTTLHTPLLSLIPLLLNSRCSETAISGLEIVGAASLFSIEMNEQIALDDEIVKALVTALGSSRRRVSMAACNALLDLFTTSIGQSQILKFSAVRNLIFCFLQVPKSSTPSVCLVKEELDGKTLFRIGFMEDEYTILLLHVTIILINHCTLEQLRNIPTGLAESFLTYLAKLWAQVHKDILTETVQESGKFFHLSNIRTSNLAESLFRLSMDGMCTQPSKFQEVKQSIFHDSFEAFIVNYWEKLPLHMTNVSNDLLQNDLFPCFSQFVRSKETVSSFLGALLQSLSSSPPISSDELDITGFLKEARENLGCPLSYQQDIRVVKTLDSNHELHYAHDILRCEAAYNEGYTFALRGMELRFKDIAAVSEGLASVFGQPSTGVNMYFTPPNSQGLARHRDDHCVLVCQIRGVKRWKVFPNPCPRLPRLYENVDYSEGENGNEMIDGCKEFFLREGDILYIPRGFPHEACTIIDDETTGNQEFSLHLTLAIEIEPPFEWEGFVHVALHHWSNVWSDADEHPSLDDVALDLLHMAVKLIGDMDPTSRKACLIGVVSFPLDSQRSTFNHLVSKLNSNCSLNNVFSNLEVAVRNNEEVFENLRWVRHLDRKRPLMVAEDMYHLIVNQKDKVEDAFRKVKSRFCDDVVFDDVIPYYCSLLEKYRSTRKRYVNGMLALSCF